VKKTPPKRIHIALAAAALVGLAAVARCADAPEEQARRARSALAELRDAARGDVWAPELYTAAAEAVAAADREVGLQGAKLGWSRDYARAEAMYARALEDVVLARGAAEAGRARAEAAARHAMEEALSSIARARAAMMVAPVPRSGRDTFARVDQELERASGRLEEVRRLLSASEFQKAQSLAGEVQTQVGSLIRTLERAADR